MQVSMKQGPLPNQHMCPYCGVTLFLYCPYLTPPGKEEPLSFRKENRDPLPSPSKLLNFFESLHFSLHHQVCATWRFNSGSHSGQRQECEFSQSITVHGIVRAAGSAICQ